MKIPLVGTSLDCKPFETVEAGGDQNHWLYCSVEDGVFHGYGSPANLGKVLEIFRQWAS